MAVISKLNLYGQDITKWDNKTISNIDLNGVDYHFAKANEVADGVCEDAVNEPIINMQIQGNSVQDGTPEIEAPIEIQSVGERTKNLVDIPIIDGSIGTKIISCYIDQTISFSCQEYPTLIARDDGTEANIWRIAFKRLDGSVTYATDSALQGEGTTLTVVTADNPIISIEYRSTYIREGAYKGIQIEYGREITSYEPYGYKIPVKASGKNLFDVSDESGWVSSAYDYYSIFVGANKTVTVSWDNDLTAGQGFYLVFGYKSSHKGKAEGVWLYHSASAGLGKQSIKVTADGDGYIYINMYTDIPPKNLSVLEKLQIEYGETATDFEPYIEPITTTLYLNEPLRKVGDYADYIDYKNKKVVRNITKYTFDGTEKVGISRTGDINQSYYINAPELSDMNIQRNMLLLSEVMTYLADSQIVNTTKEVYTVGYGGNIKFLYVQLPLSLLTTTDDLLKFLTSKTIYGVSITPTEEAIEVPEIMTFDGTTTLEIETVVEPSAMSVTYWKQI